MTTDKGGSTTSLASNQEAMRRRAEAAARQDQIQTTDPSEHMLPDAARHNLYELRVHQIELEMQNEELRCAQLDLDAERARYFELYDLAPVGYCTISAEGLILQSNLNAATLLGVPRDRLRKRLFSQYIVADFQDTYYLHRKQLLATGHRHTCELQMLHKDGRKIWVELTTTAALGEDDAPVLRVVLNDIDQRRKLLDALKESEFRWKFAIESSGDGLWDWNMADATVFFSSTWKAMLGYAEDEVGSSLVEWEQRIHADDKADALSTMQEHLDGKTRLYVSRHRLQCKDGSYKWTLDRGMVVDRDSLGMPLRAIGTHSDISAEKEMEEVVRQLAYYDPLTTLPNRLLLKDRLIRSMLGSQRGGGYCALMFLDMDNFKIINDKHGHGAGDLLLLEVARRLTSCVRQIDTVARFGGDEFVVLLDALTHDRVRARREAEVLAEKIRSRLAAPYQLQLPADGVAGKRTIEHRCGVSIGVVLFLGLENTEEEVLKWADAAMYLAKDGGRNAIRFHEAGGKL